MTDGTSIATALATAKSAVDLLKFAYDGAASLKAAEMKLRLADAIGALSDVRVQLAGVQDQLSEKDLRIRELEQAIEDKSSVVRQNDGIYRVGSDGRPGGPPYCLKCWEDTHKLRSLAWFDGGRNRCPVCQTMFDEARTGTLPVAR